MPRAAQCPSCGAAVTFRSVVSILAVCEFCRSTLLDKNGEIENLGRMAALVEDRSPLRLGAEGRWKRKRFTLVGRLQLKYEQGLWNEWFVLFDDQRAGWLSEAAGEYALFFPQAPAAPLPVFSALTPGMVLELEKEEDGAPGKKPRAARLAGWIVTDIERAECVAGEGELPFRVGGGYPAPVADLRQGSRLATLDYSEGEEKPLLFVGETVDFASLSWANLREGIPPPKTHAKTLRCASCGAPLEIKHEDIASIGCARCGAVTDAETQELVSAMKRARKVKPLIPIGAVGVFRGEKLEVLGFMQRRMASGGSNYFWREYLLARADKPGYRWLTEYDGHWNVADVLSDKAGVPPSARADYRGEVFRCFQKYAAWVDFVVGEFTWRVRAEEETQLVDYIAPPRMLSCERTKNEITWSLAEYVAPEEIAGAFALTPLPDPKGVYANQPSPWKERSRSAWKIALIACFAALALQFALRVGSTPTEYLRTSSFSVPDRGESRISAPFTLERSATLNVVSEARGLDNAWIELGLWLVNEQNGESHAGTSELSYYSGWDSEDGNWTEDKHRQTLVFRDVPPGTWRLMVEHSPDPAMKKPLTISVRVDKAQSAPWSNLLFFLLALFPWPLFAFWRSFSFESRRWGESDTGDEEDDDD